MFKSMYILGLWSRGLSLTADCESLVSIPGSNKVLLGFSDHRLEVGIVVSGHRVLIMLLVYLRPFLLLSHSYQTMRVKDERALLCLWTHLCNHFSHVDD